MHCNVANPFYGGRADFLELYGDCSYKQLPRVLEVGFGVGAGAGETFERLIQNRNNPPLFFERREGDF